MNFSNDFSESDLVFDLTRALNNVATVYNSLNNKAGKDLLEDAISILSSIIEDLSEEDE